MLENVSIYKLSFTLFIHTVLLRINALPRENASLE